jgi:hypothetical protein
MGLLQGARERRFLTSEVPLQLVRETRGPHLMCREACALSLGPIQTQPRWVCIRGGRVCGFFKGQRHAVSSKLKDTVPGRYSHRGLVLNRRPLLQGWGTMALLFRSYSDTALVGVHTWQPFL